MNAKQKYVNIPKPKISGAKILIRSIKFALLAEYDRLEIHTEKHIYIVTISAPLQGVLTSNSTTSPQGQINLVGAYKEGQFIQGQLEVGQCFVYAPPGNEAQGIKTSRVLQLGLIKAS